MDQPPFSEDIRWHVNPYSWATAQELSRVLGLPPVVGMVLAGRGFADPREALKFINCEPDIPDPFLFAHMEGAVKAISRAIDRGERVIVHGDYDADGITATALMVLGLRQFGLEAEWYLPSRFNEGYGLSRTAVESIGSHGPGLLITVDCGVNYPEEVSLAKEHGLDVIVIDHHQPGTILPECHLVHQVAGDYPHGTLCGVGLALKVLHALHIRRGGAVAERLPQQLEGMLDLVAVGTIADLATLVGENRYYVREGLKLIAIGQRAGLRALAAISGCSGSTDSSMVAFRLAPRLNAAGRLADPSPPLRLLLTDDENEAATIAQQLHELNGARQDVERRILEEAVRSVESGATLPPIIVLAGENWHEGVVGIVAARLVERYHRPAILLGVREGVAKGSGRSIAPYDIMQGLNACAEHLTVYGGHPQAAGLTLQLDRLDQFRAAIERHAGFVLRPDDLVPTFRSDAVLRGDDLDPETASALAALGPFGSGNPRPRLLLVGADLQQPEATRDGAHLRCTVRVDGVRARGIGFGMGNTASELRGDGNGKLVGAQLRVDAWQGTLRPEFVIEHLASPSKACAGFFACGPGCPSWNAQFSREPELSQAMSTASPPSRLALRLPVARDLRDRPGGISALAQVLATGEKTVVVGCCLSHMLRQARQQLPLADLCGDGPACMARGCAKPSSQASQAKVLVTEWDVMARSPALGGARAHLVAVDPPYRKEHVALVNHLREEGVHIHLHYGSEERQTTARLLRYLVHPRFAMVCVYRAMEQMDGHGGHPKQEEVLQRASELAWNKAQVALTAEQWFRAAVILEELGVGQQPVGEAKLEARNIPAYAEAEAEYEECSRLCLNL